MPVTSPNVIRIVVFGITIGALISMGTLGALLLTGGKPDNNLLLPFVSLAGQFIGALTGLLINTRSQPPPRT